jgi:hypothetical protein
MAKKMTTKKKTTAKVKRTTKSKSAETSKSATRREVPQREDERTGAPIEHYRGEPNRGKKTGDPGSLEEETLDRSAPYNKTYGR